MITCNVGVCMYVNITISQKNNLTELKMNFIPDQLYSDDTNLSDSSEEFIDTLNYSEPDQGWEKKIQISLSLFYEQVLPAVTNMLQSHTTIRLLWIECNINTIQTLFQPNWIESVLHLQETAFIHPSLECVNIFSGLLLSTHPLIGPIEGQKKTLIDRHKKEQPHKPLPIVKVNNFF